MGTTAARKSRQIVENTLSVLAFEFMAAAQGIELRKDTPSAVSQKVYDIIRSRVAYWEEDREIRIDVEAMNELVRSGEIVEAVSMLLPDFE